jgi:hypothetical protein
MTWPLKYPPIGSSRPNRERERVLAIESTDIGGISSLSQHGIILQSSNGAHRAALGRLAWAASSIRALAKLFFEGDNLFDRGLARHQHTTGRVPALSPLGRRAVLERLGEEAELALSLFLAEADDLKYLFF